MLDEAEASDETPEKQIEQPKPVTTTRVLADGTYATETVYTSTVAAARLEQVRAAAKPPLRALILGGDFFTGSVLAATLTKLVLRFAEGAASSGDVNGMRAEVRIIAIDYAVDSIGDPHYDLGHSSRTIQILCCAH